MRKIGDFEIVDHGIFYSIDCKSESFKYVVTGFGNNPAEAISGCLNQMVMSDFSIEDMEARILEQKGWDEFPISPLINEKDKYREQKRYVKYYHVSICWNEAHKFPIKGLMRCCIATLETIDDSCSCTNCESCNARMQIRDGAWERVQ